MQNENGAKADKNANWDTFVKGHCHSLLDLTSK